VTYGGTRLSHGRKTERASMVTLRPNGIFIRRARNFYPDLATLLFRGRPEGGFFLTAPGHPPGLGVESLGEWNTLSVDGFFLL